MKNGSVRTSIRRHHKQGPSHVQSIPAFVFMRRYAKYQLLLGLSIVFAHFLSQLFGLKKTFELFFVK